MVQSNINRGKKSIETASEKKKDQTYWKILNATIELDFKKGHQRWTFSDLARSAKVTRSLIYYYFGKSKFEVLQEAVRFLGEELFGLTNEKRKLWSEGKILESAIATRMHIEKSPQVPAFYLLHRSRDTELGLKIRNLEKRYIAKLKEHFPKLGDPQIEALFGLFFGLVFTPGLSEAALSVALQTVRRLTLPKQN